MQPETTKSDRARFFSFGQGSPTEGNVCFKEAGTHCLSKETARMVFEQQAFMFSG